MCKGKSEDALSRSHDSDRWTGLEMWLVIARLGAGVKVRVTVTVKVGRPTHGVIMVYCGAVPRWNSVKCFQ